jgi:hypothetical protein
MIRTALGVQSVIRSSGRPAYELVGIEGRRGKVGLHAAVLLQHIKRFLHPAGIHIAHWLRFRQEAGEDLQSAADDFLVQRRLGMFDQSLNSRLGILQSLAS